MKRTVLSIIFMAFATISASAQLSIGAGYANSNTVHKSDMPLAGHTLHGFYAKVDYGMEIIDDFMDIVPGLRYSILSSGKNADEKGEKTGIGEQYLDIPVMADLGYEFDDDFRLFALLGARVLQRIRRVRPADPGRGAPRRAVRAGHGEGL